MGEYVEIQIAASGDEKSINIQEPLGSLKPDETPRIKHAV